MHGLFLLFFLLLLVVTSRRQERETLADNQPESYAPGMKKAPQSSEGPSGLVRDDCEIDETPVSGGVVAPTEREGARWKR